MLRRVLTFLLLLTLPCSALAAHTPADSLATINQYDARFQHETYTYRSNEYRYSGCGPASVTNALIVSLGVTDEDTIAGLTLDVLRVLTSGSQEKFMDVNQLSSLSNLCASGRYPHLAAALTAWDGTCFFYHDVISAATISDALRVKTDHPRLLMGFAPEPATRWRDLCSMAYKLYHQGAKDASLCIAMLGVGTIEAGGALRSGNAGHYVCLYIHVGTFCEEGAVYLVDSFPRAFGDEPFAPDTLYTRAYDFDSRSMRSRDLEEFNSRCLVERVSPTILRISPQKGAPTRNLSNSTVDVCLNSYAYFLDPIGFVNQGRIFVQIPPTAGN